MAEGVESKMGGERAIFLIFLGRELHGVLGRYISKEYKRELLGVIILRKNKGEIPGWVGMNSESVLVGGTQSMCTGRDGGNQMSVTLPL